MDEKEIESKKKERKKSQKTRKQTGESGYTL
jgi:hypothetical protein